MLNMTIPLAQRLKNAKARKHYLNEVYPSYGAEYDGARYVDGVGLREIGYCDELARRIGHRGWFTDREFQDETMRGVVWALPARGGERRLVAGYRWSGGDDTGATLYFDTLYSDAVEAAYAADEHARIAADSECDYQERERAKIAAEEAEDARLENLAACHPPLILAV